jgi:MraZ protein
VGESGRNMFFGSYLHSLDSKGRLVIPSKLHLSIGQKLFALRGFEQCLSLYLEKDFEKLVSSLETMDYRSKEARDYIRLSLSSVIEMEIDNHGRIQIPSQTINTYMLAKEIKIIGVNDHLELWEKTSWEKYETLTSESYETNADQISKK